MCSGLIHWRPNHREALFKNTSAILSMGAAKGNRLADVFHRVMPSKWDFLNQTVTAVGILMPSGIISLAEARALSDQY